MSSYVIIESESGSNYEGWLSTDSRRPEKLTNQMEYAMGKMKQISIILEEAMAMGDLPNPALKVPTVVVMMCDEKPVGVYVDKQTADFEMHLCIQGDYHEMGVVSKYELVEMPLTTHRM